MHADHVTVTVDDVAAAFGDVQGLAVGVGVPVGAGAGVNRTREAISGALS
jgi:hypothetical protein